MPRRRWKTPEKAVLDEHLKRYPCPETCRARERMVELFGVATTDIDGDFRTSKREVPLADQVVNGPKMRELIATFLRLLCISISRGDIKEHTRLAEAFSKDPEEFMGLAFAALADFCFNIEYVRRITDVKWSYCSAAEVPRVYYPYLGVCPYCIINDSIAGAVLDPREKSSKGSRYFGNKIKSHNVGRIGERIVVYLLDLLTRSKFGNLTSLLIYDDQHDVDAAFLFEGLGILTQIKASPLVLLPVASDLKLPFSSSDASSTGGEASLANHQFTEFSSAENDLYLYLAYSGRKISIGARQGENWPYEPLLSRFSQNDVMTIVDNWIEIYRSFAIPKVSRTGEDIKRAYLTSGWGAPIDDNKTKAGLARSDNMMKGTYASIKYGAYYVQECQRGSLRTALVSNIDPAHQFTDYLEKIADIKWGHAESFESYVADDGTHRYAIDAKKLSFMFDSVFTFNRRITNDSVLAGAWDLGAFAKKAMNGELDEFLHTWSKS